MDSEAGALNVRRLRVLIKISGSAGGSPQKGNARGDFKAGTDEDR
jgi:hypothetical protein